MAILIVCCGRLMEDLGEGDVNIWMGLGICGVYLAR